MTDANLAEQLEAARPRGEALCARLAAEIRKLGFPDADSRSLPRFGDADFHLVKDPYSGDIGLHGTWNSPRGYRVGGIQLHGDGSFYAEYDVGEPHPTDRRWFVEAVTAWGRDDLIKSEPKLLAALS
jgi:hypothetical protein